MVTRFPAKKNADCPKAPRDFPPRKEGIFHPASGSLPISLPQRLYGRTYADVRTKISRIDRLPDLFTNGPPRDPLKKLLSKLKHKSESLFSTLTTERGDGSVQEEGGGEIKERRKTVLFKYAFPSFNRPR